MERNPKTLFQLDTPYSETQWPSISSSDQETLLELLTSLLAPIGDHRSKYVVASKGKRSKKRKQHEVKTNGFISVAEEQDSIPPAPEISSHILVGLNTLTRHLEELSHSQRPETQKLNLVIIPADHDGTVEGESVKASQSTGSNIQHLAVVFVCRSSQPSILHAHLPQLIATASLASHHLPAIRLVQLPRGCENRLCSSLGLPRASFVAIMEDAPHSKALIGLVRDVVPAIEVLWLKEAQKAQYRPLRIKTIHNTGPVV